MDSTTRRQTEELFLEVSRAATRKKLYSLKAAQSGQQQLSRLFRAIAISEEAQAKRLLIQLRGQTGSNSENSNAAFSEEIPTLIRNYADAAETAQRAEENAMNSVFSQCANVQRKHLSLQKKLESDSDLDTSYHVCGFCGFIMAGKAPKNCPICTAPTSRFVE
jgi:rubrerythrin